MERCQSESKDRENMKILVTSDWHADAITGGFERYDDVREQALIMAQYAVDNLVEAWLFLGDLTDPDNTRSHRAVALAKEVIVLLDAAGIPSYWLVGNHDVIKDGRGSHTLATLGLGDTMAVVIDTPTILRVGTLNGDVVLIGLPFTSPDMHYDATEYLKESAKDIELANHGGDIPTIVMGHLHFSGAKMGSESTDMSRGREMRLPIGQIKKQIPGALIMNGHYHTPQCTNGVYVPGSPERLRFDEEHNNPGFLIVETL